MDNFAANIVTRTSPSQATILIVDDDPSNLASLGALLHEHFKVLEAYSGDRALQIAGAVQKPVLILLDVLMPHLGGDEVITALPDNRDNFDVLVIHVAGLDSSEDEEHSLALGAVDYIAKPYRPAIILARIHNHLEIKRAPNQLAHQNAYLEAEVGDDTVIAGFEELAPIAETYQNGAFCYE